MEHRYDEFPPQWDVTPHALLGIIGAKQHHTAMRTALTHQCASAEPQVGHIKNFSAISLDDDFEIAPKGSPPTGIKKFVTPIEGLLKTNWLDKWYRCIPGLILLMVDLKEAGRTWEAQETFICDAVEKLRQKTLERKINVAVILVLTAREVPRDEQIFSLKKRAQLDAKQVYKLTTRELQKPDSAMVAKTWKNAQDMLISFYSTAIRKYTKHLNLKVVKSYVPLQARHTFKIAYFLEVLGENLKAQHKYETAIRLATRISPSEPFDSEQIKIFAALCMWRIYAHTLRDKKAVDAHRSKIFRNFLLNFRKRVGACRYRHFGWLAQQCLNFARKLDKFDEASSILEKPVHFRNLAVQYAVEQRLAAQEAGLYGSDVMGDPFPESGASYQGSDDAEMPAKSPANITIQPSEYVGGVPMLLNTATAEPLTADHKESNAFAMLERFVDHSSNIKKVLKKCIAYDERSFITHKQAILARRGSSNKKNTANAKDVMALFLGPFSSTSRYIARKKCVLAEECYQSSDFEAALRLFQEILPVYEGFNWESLSRFVLQRIMQTAKACMSHSVVVDATLRLMSRYPDTRTTELGQTCLQALEQHREANDGKPHTIVLHESMMRDVFNVVCLFDRQSASSNDTVSADIAIRSNFPANLRWKNLKTGFNHASYNCECGKSQTTGDDTHGVLEVPTEGTVSRSFSITIGNDDSMESFNLQLEHVTAKIIDEAGNALCHIKIPVEDDGSKSIAATAAADHIAASISTNSISSGNGFSSTAAAGTSMSRSDRQHQRRHWLAIVPASARAVVKVTHDECLLYGAAHVFHIRLEADSDTCRGACLDLQFEGLRAATAHHDLECVMTGISAATEKTSLSGESGKTDASSSEDISQVNKDAGSAFSKPVNKNPNLDFIPNPNVDPLLIDEDSGKVEAIKIPEMFSGQTCTVQLKITSRAVQRFRMAVSLSYNNGKGCAVITKPVHCSWRCVNPVEVEHFVDYLTPNIWPWLSVGQNFMLRSEYRCNEAHGVELLQVDIRLADKKLVKSAVEPVWQQQPAGTSVEPLAILAPGDVFSTFSVLCPLRPFQGPLGQSNVLWRRSGVIEDHDAQSVELERMYSLPTVQTANLPLLVSVDVPKRVYSGEVIPLRVHIVNQTHDLQTVNITIAANEAFYITGEESVQRTILGRHYDDAESNSEPLKQVSLSHTTETVEWKLLPLGSSEGMVNLPHLAVYSENYGCQLLEAADVPKIFIQPPNSP